jgi:hypothetical protein
MVTRTNSGETAHLPPVAPIIRSHLDRPPAGPTVYLARPLDVFGVCCEASCLITHACFSVPYGIYSLAVLGLYHEAAPKTKPSVSRADPTVR